MTLAAILCPSCSMFGRLTRNAPTPWKCFEACFTEDTRVTGDAGCGALATYYGKTFLGRHARSVVYDWLAPLALGLDVILGTAMTRS